MDRPKCKFGRHEWDERENPETHEVYEICLRCDDYRDSGPPAAPGTGPASAAIANIGGFGT